MHPYDVILLVLVATAGILAIAHIYLSPSWPWSKQVCRIKRSNDFGWAMVHLNRSMRLRGLEPSVIDLRHVERAGEPSLLALGQYPYSYLVHFGAVR